MKLLALETHLTLLDVEVDRIIDDGPFNVYLSGSDGSGARVEFLQPTSYRLSDEGKRPHLVKLLSLERPLRWMYELLESEYLLWFETETDGIYSAIRLKHYLIVTRNDLIDVLSVTPPVIEPIQLPNSAKYPRIANRV